jgi:hypothetical protein
MIIIFTNETFLIEYDECKVNVKFKKMHLQNFEERSVYVMMYVYFMTVGRYLYGEKQ